MFNISKRLLKQVLDVSPLATLVVDLKTHPHPVVYVNQAFEAVSGYDAAELVGHPWSELLVDDAAGQPAAGGASEVRLNCHPRFGVNDELQLDMVPLYDQPGVPRYWVGTESTLIHAADSAADPERNALLSVLRDAQTRLRGLDGRDTASGLLNQRAFDDMLQRDWLMARRQKRPLSLVVLRIEAFADYREVFGRHAADSCVAKVAHAISGTLRRAGDLSARLADDQFVALVDNTAEQDVLRLAEKIAAKVRGLSIHHPRSHVDRFVSVSFGVATGVPSAELNPADLLEQARSELPQSGGGSRISFG